MRIGYSQLDSDSEFDYGHDESDSKIGKTKSIAYPIGKALDCPISYQKALGVIVDDDIVLRFR